MTMEIDKIKEYWNEVSNMLTSQIDEQQYSIHIKPIKIEIKDDTIYLIAINELSANIIQKNYSKKIIEIFTKKLGYTPKILIESAIKVQTVNTEQKIKKRNKKITSMDELSLPLNPFFRFDTFIEGINNRLAAAIAKNISKEPEEKYNPFFIYGESGLGKTHLMQAIGNEILEENERRRQIQENYKDRKVFYTTGENFTSLYVDAVRENKLQALRKKIRSFDIFLLDDIQFLLNKEGTINEFFHTFNALYESNKHIVLTSDRAPKDLDMDVRLLSRFEQGIFQDIVKPDYETRLAILKDKVFRENMQFTDDVLSYIATLITDNIRQLMGALTKLIAEASLLNKTIDLEFAKKTLDKYYNDGETKRFDIKVIQEKSAEHFNVTVNDLLGQSRVKEIAMARQVAMYLAREFTEMSYPSIAKAFGKKDHTTVIHALKKIENLLATEPGFREAINNISSKIIN